MICLKTIEETLIFYGGCPTFRLNDESGDTNDNYGNDGKNMDYTEKYSASQLTIVCRNVFYSTRTYLLFLYDSSFTSLINEVQ